MRLDWDAVDWVLLDLDGTILERAFDDYFWEQLLPERLAAARGLPLARARELVARRSRATRGTLQWYCLDSWSQALGLDLAALKREQIGRVALRPDSLDFLRGLAGGGLRPHLVTNAHPTAMKLKVEQTNIARHFAALHSSADYGHPKESADFWPALQRHIGFRPQRTLFIDDDAAVLAAARAAGIGHLRQMGAAAGCIGGFAELGLPYNGGAIHREERL